MSVEENKAIVHKFINEVANGGDVERAGEFVAPGFVEHNGPPGLAQGVEGAKQLILIFRAAFPDWHFAIEDTIAEGNKVVVRGTGSGTHQGDFLRIPATGKQVSVSATHTFQVEGGKIVARWAQPDMLGLMQQLGAIPGR